MSYSESFEPRHPGNNTHDTFPTGTWPDTIVDRKEEKERIRDKKKKEGETRKKNEGDKRRRWAG
jgi:hypothetical protein